MRRGFTLVEIMVVVIVLMILIMLVVPNILRSRLVANEAITLANLKTLSNALQMYHIGQNNYPDNLTELSMPETGASYIDSALASGHKQNYDFVYALNGEGFTVHANPTGLFETLNARYFYVDETGIIRSKLGEEAGANDEKIE